MILGAQLRDPALQMNISAATKTADRTRILPQALTQFSRSHPAVQVNVIVGRSADTEAIVSFVPSGQDNAHIRKISMRDGSTVWEKVLDRRLTENVDGMMVGDRYVFVIYGGTKILDLDSGDLVATVGGAW